MSSSPQGASTGRKLLFTLIASVIGLLAVEGAAWGIEQLRPHTDELLPIPAAMGNSQVPHEVWQRFAKMDAIEMSTGDDNPWSLPPDQVVRQGSKLCRINSLGLRGPEVGDTGLKLMTTGDSSIFGYGVDEDEVFSSIAAATLAEAWGQPVEPVIGGVPGYSSRMSRTQLENVIPTVKPTWVVIGNIWSDLAYHEEEPRPERTPLERLATFRLAVDLLGPFLSPRQISWIDPSALGQLDVRAERVATYQAELTQMIELARAHAATAVILALPAPVDLDRRQVPALVRAYRAAQREVATATQAPFVDGVQHALERGATHGWYFDEVHPSVKGHAELGALLGDALLELGKPRAHFDVSSTQ